MSCLTDSLSSTPFDNTNSGGLLFTSCFFLAVLLYGGYIVSILYTIRISNKSHYRIARRYVSFGISLFFLFRNKQK